MCFCDLIYAPFTLSHPLHIGSTPRVVFACGVHSWHSCEERSQNCHKHCETNNARIHSPFQSLFPTFPHLLQVTLRSSQQYTLTSSQLSRLSSFRGQPNHICLSSSDCNTATHCSLQYPIYQQFHQNFSLMAPKVASIGYSCCQSQLFCRALWRQIWLDRNC